METKPAFNERIFNCIAVKFSPVNCPVKLASYFCLLNEKP